ncbi:MAG: nucleotide exchange factor GrpE [Pseudomonadota bacterium]
MTGQENETLNEDDENQSNQTAEITDVEEVAATTEEPIPVEPSEDEIENLRSLLEKEQEQAQAHLDTALRAQAEMENLRKRTTRDIENAHKYALDKFVNELLPVVDSLELGISAAVENEHGKEMLEGMELTLKMLSAALEKFGVKHIQPEGEKFNPEFHEAVSMQPVEGKESGTVISVMQKGYELNGRLVRAAMVMVAK